jgi:signal transduction protein with GAF and PtsI domain
MLLALDAAELKTFLHDELESSGSGDTLRQKLIQFAETRGIPV